MKKPEFPTSDDSPVPEEHINPVNGLQHESHEGLVSAKRKKTPKKEVVEEVLYTPDSSDSAR